MERFWLQANKLGLSVQPLGALSLFLARLNLVGGEGFSMAQRENLSVLQKGFAAITPDYDEDKDQIVMLFRLGYEKKKVLRPYRRGVESFFI